MVDLDDKRNRPAGFLKHRASLYSQSASLGGDMTRKALAGLAFSCALLLNGAAAHAESPGHITGVGGIFFRSSDPKALMAWYRDMLGISVESWGGAAMKYDAPGHPQVLVLNAFSKDSAYMAPSKREFMLNFAVDDLDAFVATLRSKGVPILKRDDSDPSGKFAWIVDPEGTKIELWESKEKPK